MDDGFAAHQNISKPPILSQYESAIVQDDTAADDTGDIPGNSEDYYNNAYTGVVHVPCGSCGNSNYFNSNNLTTSESIDITSDYNFASGADASMF